MISQSIPSPHKEDEMLLVDMNNLFFHDRDEQKRFKIENVWKFGKQLNDQGYCPVVFVADSTFRHNVDNKQMFEFFKKSERIVEAAYGTKADVFVLKLTKDYKCKFLTNDKYREYREEFGKKWIFEHSVGFTVVRGKVYTVERGS